MEPRRSLLSSSGIRNLQSSISAPLRLRGHHLLCILGFRGLGYDAGFTANMARIVRRVRAHPNALLELIVGPDSICAACPHLRGHACRAGGTPRLRVPARDRAVLRALGLSVGARVTARQAYALVRARITPTTQAARICAGCSWLPLGYCLEGLRALKK